MDQIIGVRYDPTHPEYLQIFLKEKPTQRVLIEKIIWDVNSTRKECVLSSNTESEHEVVIRGPFVLIEKIMNEANIASIGTIEDEEDED